MDSYFFHRDPIVAPAPPEYVAFSLRRALWQSLGVRPDDLTAREYFATVAILEAESADAARRRGQH